MPDPDLAYWRSQVRRCSREAGHQLSTDAVDELASHIADVYAAARDRGQTDADARTAALAIAAQGAYADVAECERAAPSLDSQLLDRAPSPMAPLWFGLGFDVRYSWRSMRRQPAFTLAVVVILSVAIGASTAGYAVIDAVLLQPLPYPEPQQLIVLKHVTPKGEGRSFATADWRDYQSRHQSSVALAAYASWPMNVTGGGEPERLRSVIVSGNFFDVMGQAPAVGRVSTAEDDGPAAARVVVLSHAFWNRRFGAGVSAVGSTIIVNGAPATVIGVMSRDFAFPDRDVDLWMPMGLAPAVLADRAGEWVSVVGRMQSAVDERTLQADLAVTAAALAQAYPKTNQDERALLRPLLQEVVGGARRPLWLGGLAVLFVLLAGCANAVNLMIGRAALRRDEIAIRAGLGAEPMRIGRQLAVESAVMTAIGGGFGVVAAMLFLRAFVALGSDRVPRIDHVALGSGALLTAVGTTLVVALIFGVTTAWLLVRTGASGPATAPVRVTAQSRLGGLLLGTQLALALILLTAATMVGGSYAAAVRMAPGFDTSDTLTMQLTLPGSRYRDTAAHVRFAERAVAELSAVPGVTSAGIVSDLPFVANALHFRVGAPGAGQEATEQVTVRPADPGFFRTLRIPLQAGRVFGAEDRDGAPPVMILNRTAAERLVAIAGVGGRLQIAGEQPRIVVGVVGDIRHAGLRADEGPVVYVPYAQKSFAFLNWMGIVVRGIGVDRSTAAIRGALARVDAEQPLHALRMMDDYLAAEAAPFQFGSLVIGALAAAALVLAMTGTYGMTAFVVGRRSREIGVRVALGATRAGIVRLVLTGVAVTIAAGSVMGLTGAVIAGRMLRVTLENAGAAGSAIMPLVIGVALLAMTAVAAALGPALRAARIDPRAALQSE